MLLVENYLNYLIEAKVLGKDGRILGDERKDARYEPIIDVNAEEVVHDSSAPNSSKNKEVSSNWLAKNQRMMKGGLVGYVPGSAAGGTLGYLLGRKKGKGKKYATIGSLIGGTVGGTLGSGIAHYTKPKQATK